LFIGKINLDAGFYCFQIKRSVQLLKFDSLHCIIPMLIRKSQSSLIAILIQILVWIVFAISILFYKPLTGDIIIPYQLWIKQVFVLIILMGAYYLNALVLVPRFLLQNRVGYFLALIMCTIILIVELNNFADEWLNLSNLMDQAFHRHGPPKPYNQKHHHYDSVILIITALVLGISTSITTIQKWQAEKQVHLALEQENTLSELAVLKAQINPHFFFNTLNNIYALTIIDVEKSRVAIHKLSRMMRYVLYDTQHTYTRLSQEIDFLKDYISLMQLRLTDSVTLEFSVPDTIQDFEVAPMIFLPFIENAFKHGVSVSKPSHITIKLIQVKNTITLQVSNFIFSDKMPGPEDKSGIGLANTKRRLDLIYADRYYLHIIEKTESNKFTVNLKLVLS